MPHDNKVLRVNESEEAELYMRAVARVIVDIQRDHDATLIDIAESIGVSAGTISNAANRRGALNHVYLQRLGKRYGTQYLNPVMALMGARLAPLQANDVDPLPRILAAALKIGEARDPQSEGGEAETHRELLSMVPDLRCAIEAMQNMLLRAEKVAA